MIQSSFYTSHNVSKALTSTPEYTLIFDTFSKEYLRKEHKIVDLISMHIVKKCLKCSR